MTGIALVGRFRSSLTGIAFTLCVPELLKLPLWRVAPERLGLGLIQH